VWGPLNGVMNAVTSEVVQTGKEDKLRMITRYGTKYLAALIFPLALVASLFLGDVMTFIYGKNFAEVALLFPFLVMAHAVAVVITPAGSVPMLKNEMKKVMGFNIATAAVNIVLDFYLITRYQAFGAMLANVVSQFFSIGLALINARKYRLGIFNTYTVRVFFYNALLGGLFLGVSQYDIALRLVVAAASTAFYAFVMLKTAFNEQDVRILANLRPALPKILQPLVKGVIRGIKVSS
jgi:O-antigen/teichoic acid export membrane protein